MKERLNGYAKLLQTLWSSVKINRIELMIVLDVFKELGLVTVSDKGIITVSNDKTDLNKSAVYCNVKR
jgi:ssDNA-specific exonuclease RecJ